MAGESNNPERETALDRLGLKDSYKMAFPDVLRLGFSYADTLLLGDTDHDEYKKIWGEVAKSEIQVAVAESGATHIFLELPHFRQSLVEQFQRSAANPEHEMDVKVFANRFEHEDDIAQNIDRWQFNPAEGTQDLLQNIVAPMLTQASKLGLDVHMLDQGDGASEKRQAYRLENKLHDNENEIKRVKLEQDITQPSVRVRLEKLEQRHVELEQEFNVHRRAYYEARHENENLAQMVNRLSGDQKSLVLLGAIHGSRDNDFEEYLKGRSLKIDIAPSRQHYVTDFVKGMESYRSVNPQYGQDPADLVYFLDEGVVSTTVNTPPDLLEKIRTQAEPYKFDVSPDEQSPNVTKPTTGAFR